MAYILVNELGMYQSPALWPLIRNLGLSSIVSTKRASRYKYMHLYIKLNESCLFFTKFVIR